jgi:hypothetical protein
VRGVRRTPAAKASASRGASPGAALAPLSGAAMSVLAAALAGQAARSSPLR